MRTEQGRYRAERLQLATQPRYVVRMFHRAKYGTANAYPFSRDFASGPVTNPTAPKLLCLERIGGVQAQVFPEQGRATVGGFTFQLADVGGEVLKYLSTPTLALASALPADEFPVTVSDDFDRADSGDLGTAWDPFTADGFGSLSISGNAVGAPAPAVSSVEIHQQALGAAQWASARVVGLVGSGVVGVVVYGSAAANSAYVFAVSLAWVALYRVNGGVLTTLKQVTSVAGKAGDTLRIAVTPGPTGMTGVYLAGYLNGVSVIEVLDLNPLGVGKAGVACRRESGAIGDAKADDWSAGVIDDTIALTSTQALPAFGTIEVFRTDDVERIRYRAKDDVQRVLYLAAPGRGAHGTQRSSHPAGAAVTNGEVIRPGQGCRLYCGYAGMNESDYMLFATMEVVNRSLAGVVSGDGNTAGRSFVIETQDVQRGLRSEVFATARDEEGKRLTLSGHPLTLALQILTSTGKGVNGPYDTLPVEDGVGIDASLIDIAGIEKVRDEDFPNTVFTFTITGPARFKEWLEREILKPLNLYPVVLQTGQLTFRRYRVDMAGLILPAPSGVAVLDELDFTAEP